MSRLSQRGLRALPANAALLGCLLGFFGVAYRNLLGGAAVGWGDYPAFPSGGSPTFLKAFVFAWQQAGLGYRAESGFADLLLAALIAPFGGHGSYVQKAFYLSLLPAAMVTCYVSLSRWALRRSSRGLGALAYAINPFSIGQFDGGAAGMLVCYALLPVVAVALMDFVIEERLAWTKVFRVGILLALGFSFYLGFILISWLFFAICWLVLLSGSRRIQLIRSFGAGVLVFVIAVLLNLPMTFSLFMELFAGSAVGVVRPAVTSASMYSDIHYTYALAVPLSLLRLTGNEGSADYWLGYGTTSAWFNVLGVVLPVVCFSAFLNLGTAQRRTRILVTASVSLTVAGAIWAVHVWGPPLNLLSRLPVLFSFRNPSALIMLISFGLCALLALAVDGFWHLDDIKVDWKVSRRWMEWGCACLLSAAVLGYGWPAYTGDLGLSRLFGSAYQVPPVYPEIGMWLRDHRAGGLQTHSLILPFDPKTLQSVDVVDRGTLMNVLPNTSTEYPLAAMRLFINNDTKELGALLAPLSVDYIVLSLTTGQQGPPRIQDNTLLGSPAAYQELLNQQKDLTLVFRSSAFIVYANTIVTSSVQAFQNVAYLLPNAPSDSQQAAEDKAQAMAVLAEFPTFDPRLTLVLAGPITKNVITAWQAAKVVVSLGTPSAAAAQALLPGQELLTIYTKAMLSGPVGGISAATQSLRSIDARSLYVYVPRSAYYRVALLTDGKDDTVTVGNAVALLAPLPDSGSRGWRESSRIWLNQGEHALTLPAGTTPNLLAILESRSEHDGLAYLFPRSPASIAAARIVSPTAYQVHAPAQTVAVQLSESYDPGWTGLSVNTPLVHARTVSDMNAFILSLPRPATDLAIRFSPQRERWLVLGGWAVSAVAVMFLAWGNWTWLRRRWR